MFGRGFKVRVTGLREEEDHWAVDQWIDEKLGVKEGCNFSKADYQLACREAPRNLKLWANLAIFNGEGQCVGHIELDVTDRRNTDFVGLEVGFDWL